MRREESNAGFSRVRIRSLTKRADARFYKSCAVLIEDPRKAAPGADLRYRERSQRDTIARWTGATARSSQTLPRFLAARLAARSARVSPRSRGASAAKRAERPSR